MNRITISFRSLALALVIIAATSYIKVSAMDEKTTEEVNTLINKSQLRETTKEFKGVVFLKNDTQQTLKTNVKNVVNTWKNIEGSWTNFDLDMTKLIFLKGARLALPVFAHGKTGILPSTNHPFCPSNLFKLVSWGAFFVSDKYFIQPQTEKLLQQLNDPKKTLLDHLKDKNHYDPNFMVTKFNKKTAEQELLALNKQSIELASVPRISGVKLQFGKIIGPLETTINKVADDSF